MAILKTIFIWFLEWAARQAASLFAKWKKQKDTEDRVEKAAEKYQEAVDQGLSREERRKRAEDVLNSSGN